jgi:hypothetical protein
MPLLETIGSGAAKAFGLTSFSRFLDQFFNRTSLLVSGNGTNGSSNNIFTDSSSDNVSLTRLNNTSPGSFSPFLDNYSVYYNGSSYSQVSQNAAFQFGTGQFTIEYWVNVPQDVNVQSYWTAMASVGGVGLGQNAIAIYIGDNTSGSTTGCVNVDINASGGGLRLLGTEDIRGTGWRHIAVTRDSSNVVRLFIDGQIHRSGTSTLNIDGTGAYGLVIGISDSGQSNFFKGNISNFRVIKGTALYTSAFTPSDSKLTAIANTSFLSNQSNLWSKDLSSNNLTIFNGGGNPIISAETPFVRPSSYSTSEGVSYFFDGTGDAIQLGNNSTQDPAFMSWLNSGQSKVGTIEAWIYPTALASGDTTAYEHPSIFNKGQVLWNFGIRGNTTSAGSAIGQLRFYWYDGNQNWINSTANVRLNQWTHVAAVVNGTSVKLYINGVDVTGNYYVNGSLQGSVNFTGVLSTPNFANGTEHYMGRIVSNISHSNWQGYISNFRIVAGTQVYTSNFTPTNTPLSNISNTKLLLSGNNTQILDFTRNNNLETVGTAQISSSAKWGSGSLYFDGSGSRIKFPHSSSLNFGTGNFTIEYWINYTSLTGYQTQYTKGYTSGLLIQTSNNNGRAQIYVADGTPIAEPSNPALNTWIHYAFVRNNGIVTIYKNGVSVASATRTGNVNYNGPGAIGSNISEGSGQSDGLYPVAGYIDDFRASSIARYTSNFTPSLREFEIQ